jgi:uncharacterized protein (TIGR02118 family)
MKKGMIKVSIIYPNIDGEKFDIDYYCKSHVPLVVGLLGDALKGSTVERGLSGNTPGSPPPYLVMGNIYFDSLQEFGIAFDLHIEKLMGDLPNFTTIQPIIQVSEVII